MLVLAFHLGAQGWNQSATTGPGMRETHAMAYDSQRGRTVLFGGFQPPGQVYLGDTWEWDGTSWSQVTAAGPSPRLGPAMAYDSQRGRTVLFGGTTLFTNPSGSLSDTWEWDGATWMQVASSGPTARFAHAMAYDSLRAKCVLFGGNVNNSLSGDTWEWDGSTWSLVATTGPAARDDHAMVYDSLHGCTVLFGGLTSAGPSSDTWEWNGIVWQPQVFASGPSPRITHAMAYDSQHGCTVLFGGLTNSGVSSETWQWDGAIWAPASSTGPVARDQHAMAFDSLHAGTVLFGGAGAGGETWEWDNPYIGFPGTTTTFGAGCGSPALGLAPVANARPIINATAQVDLTNIPSSLAFVALGWSRTSIGPFALPLSMASWGMTACDLLQSSEFAAQSVTFTSSSTATFGTPLPNIRGLIGLHIYLQAWAYAPGVNPGHTIVSNGIEWAIGNS